MDKIKFCPFCGDTPEIIMIGNEHTKSRKVTVRCNNCRAERTDAAIVHSHKWLKENAIKNWNQRVKQFI